MDAFYMVIITMFGVGYDDDLPELKTRYELERERTYRGVRY